MTRKDKEAFPGLGAVLSRVLKTLRDDAKYSEGNNVTARDLAARTGRHYRSVYRYEDERSGNVPDLRYVFEFERALDLPHGTVQKLVGQQLGVIAPDPPDPVGEEEEGVKEALEEVDDTDWQKAAIAADMHDASKAAKSNSIRQAIGVSGSDRLISHLEAFDEAYPGSGEVAARWIGAVLRLGFEKHDNERLRQEFSKHFRRPEALDQEDVHLVGLALLQALGWMAHGFQAAPPNEWPSDAPEEVPDVTS